MLSTAWCLIAETPQGAALTGGRLLGIVLWIGLAGLSIALLVLMRTRWGQVQPLSKCVVLSIFAHLLLCMYAYGTRLFQDQPPGGGDQVFSLAYVDSNSSDDEAEQAERPANPWEEIVAEDLMEPDVEDVVRPQMDDDHLVRTPDPTEWIAGSEPVPAEVIPDPEVERPTADAPNIRPGPLTRSQVEAVAMEPPLAPRAPTNRRLLCRAETSRNASR